MTIYNAIVALLWIWAFECALVFLVADYLLIAKTVERAQQRRHRRAMREAIVRRALEDLRPNYEQALDDALIGTGDATPVGLVDTPPLETWPGGPVPDGFSFIDEVADQRRRKDDVEHATRWPQ